MYRKHTYPGGIEEIQTPYSHGPPQAQNIYIGTQNTKMFKYIFQ